LFIPENRSLEMAILHPFRAVRPVPDKVKEIASVPYDVISSDEARTLADGNRLSFLHIIRPEIDLPEETDEHAEAVYEMGAENLRRYVESEFAVVEEVPALYVYRLEMGGRAQTGIYGCVSVADYDSDVILKHEKTRPDKEDDRTRHILTQSAHAEPVMLTFPDNEAVDRLVSVTVAREPLYHFEADDGVLHTVWRVPGAEDLVAAFAGVRRLYVADGHHRCKAASRAAAELGGIEGDPRNAPEYAFFPAVLFPMGQMAILPYNRIIKVLPDGPTHFLKQLRERFTVEDDASAEPGEKGRISLYLDGRWVGIKLPGSRRGGVADGLDVALLGEHILEPMLGIEEPRTDRNIDFVGGIRGTRELERLVDSGKAEMAISMYPTSARELMDVSDAGLLMPPKSTWFEPKLRSGLLVHLFQ
jgi:uncharacterized protein (DUF1015 family)